MTSLCGVAHDYIDAYGAVARTRENRPPQVTFLAPVGIPSGHTARVVSPQAVHTN